MTQSFINTNQGTVRENLLSVRENLQIGCAAVG